jgi:hypothetical protein
MNFLIATSKYRVWLDDVLILLTIYFLPAISHWVPFSLSMLEPMRILVFVGFVLSYNRTNALFLAVTIPLFSSLVTGHPVFFKAILISTELTIHLSIFLVLYGRYKKRMVWIFVFALLVSKFVYYLLKSVFLNIGLIKGTLFSGGFAGQAIAAVIVTILFMLIFNKLKFFKTES